jgi:hypothetical protein
MVVIVNKSLPPFVTGNTQWVLTFILTPLFTPPLITTPHIQLSWFETPPDKLEYSTKHTIQYDIKCSIPQFSEYCKDLGTLSFIFINRNKIIGTFEVDVIVRSLTKKVDIIKNKKVVGHCILNTKIDFVKSNIPIVVRNTNVDRNLDIKNNRTDEDHYAQKSVKNTSLGLDQTEVNPYVIRNNQTQDLDVTTEKNELLKSLNSSFGDKEEKKELLKFLNTSFDKKLIASDHSEPEELEKCVDIFLSPSSRLKSINDLDSSSTSSDSIASLDSDSDLEEYFCFNLAMGFLVQIQKRYKMKQIK